MGISKFNPFKKDRQNFPGVVIPLADAPAHSQKLTEKDDKELNNGLDLAPSSENGVASSNAATHHLTIEGLRAEIESDVATASHDSAYDRMYSILLHYRWNPKVEHIDFLFLHGFFGSLFHRSMF